MSLKFKAWISGKALDQCEVVNPVVPVSKFGTAVIQCPLLIGSNIYFVRSGGVALSYE